MPIHQPDRDFALSSLDERFIDQEFLPYVRRINKLEHFFTKDCCVGHAPYAGAPPSCDGPMPAGSQRPGPGAFILVPDRYRGESEHWGYLQIGLSIEAASLFSFDFDKGGFEWLLPYCSMLWEDGESVGMVTEHDTVLWGFGWDSSWWPEPAEDLVTCFECVEKKLEEMNADQANVPRPAKDQGSSV